jgi:probable addiction module antidote protein
MSKTKARSKLVQFDAARYLTDDAAVAEYMTAVLETEDPDLLLLALGDVARARGMALVAKEAGLGRESLYNPSSTLPARKLLIRLDRRSKAQTTGRA